MSFLPAYYRHLTERRGLSFDQAAPLLVGNAFASAKQRMWFFANLAADKATGGGGGKGKKGGSGGGGSLQSGEAKKGQWVVTSSGRRGQIDHVYDDNKTEAGRLVQVDLGNKKVNARETALKLSKDQKSKWADKEREDSPAPPTQKEYNPIVD